MFQRYLLVMYLECSKGQSDSNKAAIAYALLHCNCYIYTLGKTKQGKTKQGQTKSSHARDMTAVLQKHIFPHILKHQPERFSHNKLGMLVDWYLQSEQSRKSPFSKQLQAFGKTLTSNTVHGVRSSRSC